MIGTREALIGYGRATLDAGETTTVPITLTDDLSTFESEVASSYGGTIDLSLEYTVSFDTRDGNSIEPVILQRGQDIGAAISARPDPTRSPDSFLGWKVGSVSGESVDANTTNPVVQDVELVASWTAVIEVRNLASTIESLPYITNFDGTVYYDLIDSAAYSEPTFAFSNISSSGEFIDTWYPEISSSLVDSQAEPLEETSNTRLPLSGPNDDQLYRSTGIVPGKEWRVLLTTWNDRTSAPSGQGALLSASFSTEDGLSIVLDAADSAGFAATSWC